jgi:DNA repair exonuclease SbcCD ATPase subunit
MEPGFDPIWQPVTNGRREDYEEQIGRLIGSLPLFLRSAFVSQRATKRNPDLSDATELQRKQIFRELAGLDYIQAYSDSARARAAALEGQLTVGRGQVAVIERAVAGEEDVQTSIAESERDVKTADIRIANLTMQGKALKEETDRLAKLVAEQDAFGKEIHDAANQAQTKIAGAELAREKVEKLQEALAYQPAAQEQIATHGKLKAEEAVENERLSGINKERARLLSAHADAVTAHRDLAQRLQAAKTKVATAEAARKGDRNVLTAQIQQAAAGRKTISGCPKCGYIDPQIIKERAEADVRADTWKTKASQVDRELQDLARHVKEADANLIALLEPMKPTLPAADEREITHIRSALSDIDITAARATLEIAAKAEQEIATLAAQIATLDADAAALTSQVEAKRSQLDSEIAPAHAEALRKLDAARQAFTSAKEARATAAAKLEAAQKSLAAIQKQKCELEELRASLAKMEAEAAEWRYLEQACGPDGIQALELDALGPGIAETTNKILSSAYGSRFAIEIKTTRIAGKGKSTRQVEDFAIVVLDNEMLTEQPIETLSGGESVWIRFALFSAFSIIRDRTIGLRFLTKIFDEADGALDAESRQKYFAMIEAAHLESGTRHTIVVTHSPDLQEAIQQRIVMHRSEEALAIQGS